MNMKLTRLSTVVILFSLSLALAGTALGKEKDEDSDSESENDVTIEKTTLAKKTADGFEPVKSFKPNDTFAVIVELSEAKIGTKLKAVWIAANAGGKQDETILEKRIAITRDAIKGVEKPNQINFSLTHDDPFPAGDYEVEIYLNGELEKTVEFTVK